VAHARPRTVRTDWIGYAPTTRASATSSRSHRASYRSRQSQARLDKAQEKLEELLNVDDDGRATTAPFASADDD
jgi:phosphoserine aminotransferase